MHPHHTTRDSILARLDRSGECWLWPGYTNTRAGYGRIWYQGRHHLVHRLVYEFLVGPVPEGHDLHHICQVLRCANPAHLRPVTRHEHTTELSPGCMSYEHAHATVCKRGHALEGDNLRLAIRHGRMVRQCRACDRIRGAVSRAKKRATKPAVPSKPKLPRPEKVKAVLCNVVCELSDGTCGLLLTQGRQALIDACDVPKVLRHRWHAHKCGTLWYARAKIGAEYLTLQRFIMQPQPDVGVRVHNGDTLDCRRANLWLGPRRSGFNRGVRNGRWKGARTSTDGMHQRAIRTFALPRLCEVCHAVPPRDRHHVDGNSSNNARDNIMFCCRRCHMTLDGRLEQIRLACERRNASRRTI